MLTSSKARRKEEVGRLTLSLLAWGTLCLQASWQACLYFSLARVCHMATHRPLWRLEWACLGLVIISSWGVPPSWFTKPSLSTHEGSLNEEGGYNGDWHYCWSWQKSCTIDTTVSDLCQNKLALIVSLNLGAGTGAPPLFWIPSLLPPALNVLLYSLGQHSHAGRDLNLEFHRSYKLTEQACQK